MIFESYDERMGCVAVEREGKFYVVFPNGKADQVESWAEARSIADCNNLTMTDKEKRNYKTDN